MKTIFEVVNHWIQYGRPGGTVLDFDVIRGCDVLGRFATRELAQEEVRRLQGRSADRVLGNSVDEEFEEYEIREIEVPD